MRKASQVALRLLSSLGEGSFLLFVFPLILLWRALFAGEAFFWGTPLLQFVPWQRMAAEMWRAGHPPLWNPLAGCGAPLVANYQTAGFYPLNALYLLLPAEVALSWTVALHLTMAGLGMYAWGRSSGLDRFPALVGALALEGSGFLVARAALFPSIALTFPWLAIWLWRTEVLVRRERLADSVWLGLSIGMGLLAGHAQTAWYGGVLLAGYVIFRLAQREGNRKREAQGYFGYALRGFLRFGLAVAAGVGLASVQLLPTAELMLQSQRSGGADYEFAMTYSLWPWRLITFLAPDLFGNPGRGDYWGYATYWEDAAYIGVLPVFLAATAVLRRRVRERKPGGAQVWFWTFCGISALLLALGDNTPLFPFLFHHVPGFDWFQSPARWLAVVTVALAALSALGAQWWPEGRIGTRRGALWAVVGVALLVGGALAPRVASGVRPTFGAATVRLGGTLAVAGMLALLRRRTAWWQVATAVFITVDLLLFGWELVPTVGRSLFRGQTETAASLRDGSGTVRLFWPTDPTHRDREVDLEQQVKFRYLTFDDFGPGDAAHWWEMRETLLPNAGMLDGVAAANNFEPLLVGWYADLLSAAVESPGLLRVMGVTHIASDRTGPEGKPDRTRTTATVYRLADALGRAWFVSGARHVARDEMLAALTDPAFEPSAEVLLEVEPRVVKDPLRLADGLESVTLWDGHNRTTIRAQLRSPKYLVVADTWYPGWRATVDGVPAELLRANYAYRAVWLEAGDHTVEMIYHPTLVIVGGVVSLAMVALLVMGLALTRRRG